MDSFRVFCPLTDRIRVEKEDRGPHYGWEHFVVQNSASSDQNLENQQRPCETKHENCKRDSYKKVAVLNVE